MNDALETCDYDHYELNVGPVFLLHSHPNFLRFIVEPGERIEGERGTMSLNANISCSL